MPRSNSGVPDENKIRDVINRDGIFEWNGEKYIVEFCDKPTTDRGEPKTDTFVRSIYLSLSFF